MSSQVYFTDFGESSQRNIYAKLAEIMDKMPLAGVVAKGDLTAVKVHFGERGNTAFVPPHYVRAVVQKIKVLGAKPFVTDANTLYVGSRSNSVDHLETAQQHGFTYSLLGCPVLIADGLRGGAYVEVEVKGAHLKKVKLAHDLYQADAIVCVTHFKGHELAGFGGSIKNLGMGGGARGGKLAMHSDVSPIIKAEKCIKCGKCAQNCPADAIAIDKYAVIDPKKCIGCGSCIVVCPVYAARNGWDSGARKMQEKMVEHLAGFAQNKKGEIGYLNFIMNVSPACDCYGHADNPIVPDLGICASVDPVAIDAASNDLVMQAEGQKNSALEKAHKPGSDKFRDIYPEVDWAWQLAHAEKMGLGSRKYELVKVE
ncbi:DUF362 domain-containing protein [candidate division TA06 bacterium]|uniref:DUF362 domain-containing protein n=1 Tax=candidate division TA06 bacterium TaxID=2250710 RepID=A0A933MH69_UNCT6|nr:DUF362 domain-containing protein [candidate division TA06 bacterium]